MGIDADCRKILWNVCEALGIKLSAHTQHEQDKALQAITDEIDDIAWESRYNPTGRKNKAGRYRW